MSLKRLFSAMIVLLTSGCATILDGGGQLLTVNTSPAGATCSLTRNGRLLGVVASTPGTVWVDKGRKTIVATCTRPGYEPFIATDPSDEDGTIFTDLIFTGPIGPIVDLSTAADYHYKSNIVVTLARSPY